MFNIIIASDYKHNNVFAEIYYQEKFVALLSQEKGFENLELEFPDCSLIQDLVMRVIPLTEFMDLIDKAKTKLKGE